MPIRQVAIQMAIQMPMAIQMTSQMAIYQKAIQTLICREKEKGERTERGGGQRHHYLNKNHSQGHSNAHLPNGH